MVEATRIGTYPIAALYVVVVCLSTGAIGSACGSLTDTNATAAKYIGPARFVATAADCCQLCTETSGCTAAVFASYMCRLAYSVTATAPATDCVLLAVTPPTPVPTVTPSPALLESLVAITTCQYASLCSIDAVAQDFSCVTTTYHVGRCQSTQNESFIGSCNNASGTVSVMTYSGPGCRGVPTSVQTVSQLCSLVGGFYTVGTCIDEAPSLGATIEVLDCTPSFPLCQGTCQQSVYEDGVCIPNATNGTSVIARCMSSIVTIATFMDENCSTLIAPEVAFPTNTCYTDEFENGHGCFCTPK